jgi:hypothetical protein
MVLKLKQHLLLVMQDVLKHYHLLVFDEAAFIDKIEEIWVSAQSTLINGW